MDFNTLLLRLGIHPDNFINKENEPIKINNGFLYDVEQAATNRKCLHCDNDDSVIIGYYFTETKCSESDNFKDILRIKRVRLKCKKCGRTFSPPISGIERYSTISQQVKQFILNDFVKPITFAHIGEKYSLTKNRIMQMFDDKVRYVPRRKMPHVLCIDEIKFSEEIDQKYCCVLYDFENKEIVDIIKNRQMPFLREYFSNIPIKERENTRVFISDMYDAYASVCTSYFPKAIHVVDMFHIVTQLTRAVNTLRVNTMNSYTEKKDPYYNFMKSKWKCFLCRTEKIPDKRYTHMKTGETFHYDEMVYKCISFNNKFSSGYLALQDLFHFPYYSNYEESLKFIEFLSQKLDNSFSILLKKVGETYHRWRFEIANAFTVGNKEIRYTNAIAECLNNQLKTIIKSAYGYHNFERFRKRAMLITTYRKKP